MSLPSSAATLGTPTVTVKPATSLIGNETLTIRGTAWTASHAVTVDLCGGTVADPVGSCLPVGSPLASKHGSWSLAYEPVMDNSSSICQATCFVQATQGSTVADAGITALPPEILVRAHRGPCCYIGQVITVTAEGFPVGDPVQLELCSSGCDPSTITRAVSNGPKGRVSFTGFEMNWDDCSDGCALVATDTTYADGPVSVSDDLPVYCGPIACPPLAFGPSGGGAGRLHAIG
jgi:hypothetical protein